jgi:hypothetical protein
MANLGKALLSTLMILSLITQSLSALSAPCPDMEPQKPHSMMHMQSTDIMHMDMDCCDKDSCPMDSCSVSGLLLIPNTLTHHTSSTAAPTSRFKQTYNSIQITSLYRPPILS